MHYSMMRIDCPAKQAQGLSQVVVFCVLLFVAHRLLSHSSTCEISISDFIRGLKGDVSFVRWNRFFSSQFIMSYKSFMGTLETFSNWFNNQDKQTKHKTHMCSTAYKLKQYPFKWRATDEYPYCVFQNQKKDQKYTSCLFLHVFFSGTAVILNGFENCFILLWAVNPVMTEAHVHTDAHMHADKALYSLGYLVFYAEPLCRISASCWMQVGYGAYLLQPRCACNPSLSPLPSSYSGGCLEHGPKVCVCECEYVYRCVICWSIF